MINDQIRIMIESYFDKELEKNKESVLFEKLSLDEEAREYFKIAHSLKNILDVSQDEFPEELDKRIFGTIEKKIVSKESFFSLRKFSYVFAYSFAVVMAVITLLFYYDMRDYKEKLSGSIEQINSKQKEIELLINGMPTVEVENKIQNPVIIKANL